MRYSTHIRSTSDVPEISKHPSVLSVFPNRKRKLLTTRSWSFLGDSPDGVWPESPSFSDDDLGPILSRWKGICDNEEDKSFKCNRKPIGARYLYKGYIADANSLNPPKNSSRDDDGHDSHTLSTTGGAFEPGENINGYANGTAKGGSPAAQVATYKMCWGECHDANILASFDATIHDGADVISVSLGGEPQDYFNDASAIGSFHAVRRGVAVVFDAGNDGLTPGSVSNVSPWMLTVAASTTDRSIPAYVTFADKKLEGKSLSLARLQNGKLYAIINSKEANAANATQADTKGVHGTPPIGPIKICYTRQAGQASHSGHKLL